MSVLATLRTLLEKANQNPGKVTAILEYLTFFGYIAKGEEVSIDKVLLAINRFQDQFGIRESGIGKATLNGMTWPRCAVKERQVEAVAGMVAKWGTSNLTYYIRGRDTDLPPNIWDECMARSFNNWSAICNLKFTKVDQQSQANIVIDVGSGRADDFDGPSGTLAWFQLVPSPNFRGQIEGKFDLSETWVKDANGRGIILPCVGTHEFGHAIGLVHSNVSSALMAPFYSPNVEKPQQNDDIPRAQSLYGKPTEVPPPIDPPPPPPPVTPPGVTTIVLTGNINSIVIPGYRVTKMG